ncbi:MAG: CBS domain-containing protein [Nitrospirae bacterium]|nr:CBS domain-containing protein [Nitrospirota bacterium]
MDIITSHLNADFDSLASMIAAKKLYPDAFLAFPGSQERKVRDFIEVFRPAEIRKLRDIEPSEIRRLIIVDTKQPDRIGIFSEAAKGKDVRVVIFDHHPIEDGDIRGDVEHIETVGATATIFTELLKEKGLHPDPMEATILALGIYEETGCLLFPSTTERDLTAVSYLLRRGAILNIVSEYVKTELGKEELEILNELLQASRELVVRGIRVTIAKASRDSYFGDAALLAHKLMDLEDIDAVVLILAMQGRIILVGRSRVKELDVAALLKEFGGGGHHAAASATIRGDSLEMVEEQMIRRIPEHIKPGKTAADIMTSPVISIPWDSAIREAEDMMTKFGVNVLPVIHEGEYAGLISRETVEKAIFHGFKKNRIADFCSTEKLTVTADTPIRDIETMMIEHNQKFMPVLEGKRITGAITRTDLLRVLYEEFLKKRRIDKEETADIHFSSRNLSSWLRDRFPSEVFSILKLSGTIAEGLGFSAYLVGGSVRDLLLGKANLDIDLVIEGDGIRFANILAGQIRARVKPHHKFGTAQVKLGTLRIDVATARTEYYESPAALPKVETSSIKKDLYRRDFTINTLAVRLNPGDFGLLIDFFGGQRDLKEKTIRVLHNLSFVEDPTRAFRAIRFSERFGFRLSKHTAFLMKSTIEMNLFAKLSGTRLYEELLLSFNETNPVLTLKRLSDYGLLKVIHANITFDKQLEGDLEATAETLAWYNLLYLDEKIERGLLYLMTLLSHLDDRDRTEALARLSTPLRARKIILEGMRQQQEILAGLPSKDPVSLYHLLSERELEIILFSMSSTRDAAKKKDISHFLVELRKVRPILKGDDLKKLGLPQGPIYSKILDELQNEKLAGRLHTEADEINFVRKRSCLGDIR